MFWQYYATHSSLFYNAFSHVSVAFGSIVVDLTSCEDLAVPCNVGLDCAFGELTVLVPKAYRTELIRSAAFGNVEEIGTCDPAAEKVLTLSCDVSFGHIIIRYL